MNVWLCMDILDLFLFERSKKYIRKNVLKKKEIVILFFYSLCADKLGILFLILTNSKQCILITGISKTYGNAMSKFYTNQIFRCQECLISVASKKSLER